MTTLVINDLMDSKDLDRNAMAGVYGGDLGGYAMPGYGYGSATLLLNQVKNITKVFTFSQANAAALTNSQVIGGGNGITDAKVDQYNDQDNTIVAF